MGPVLKNDPFLIPETFIDIMDISKTLPERIRELSASVDSDPALQGIGSNQRPVVTIHPGRRGGDAAQVRTSSQAGGQSQ